MSRFLRLMTVVGAVAVIFGLAYGSAFADTVAYWSFNGDLTDSSGNGHNGAASGTIGYTGDGKALELSSGHVVIPGSSNFQFAGSFTVETRAKFTSGAVGGIIDCTAASGGAAWWMRANGGKLNCEIENDGSGDDYFERYVFGSTTINDDKWHQLAMVYDSAAGTHTIYVDYTQETLSSHSESGTSFTSVGTGTDFNIGLFHNGLYQFGGALDYIRVSNAALSPSQFITIDTPEPSVLILMATGLVGLLAYAWRKRK
jgi:MSHA biogenesis protein MshQ